MLLALAMAGGIVLSPAISQAQSAAPPAPQAQAQGPSIVDSQNAIIDVYQRVSPAVVNITYASESRDAIGRRVRQETSGSGFIIDRQGHIVTNQHVVGDTTDLDVTLSDNTTFEGHVTATDRANDLALVTLNAPPEKLSQLAVATLGDSGALQVGQIVVAIGNPFGLNRSASLGIVSSLGRSRPGVDSRFISNMIQTDAAINPGNSGGPLIDTEGQVIGMNTAVAGTSNDGTSAQNIGFAIPIAQVESLIPELVKGGAAASGGGYLGVDITTMTSALRQQYGFTPTSGAVILSVIAGSPADKAGLSEGDVIVAIDGKAVTSAESLQSIVQKDKAGQSISVTYYVGNIKRTAQLTLESQAQAQQQQSQSQSNSGTLPFGG